MHFAAVFGLGGRWANFTLEYGYLSINVFPEKIPGIDYLTSIIRLLGIGLSFILNLYKYTPLG